MHYLICHQMKHETGKKYNPGQISVYQLKIDDLSNLDDDDDYDGPD